MQLLFYCPKFLLVPRSLSKELLQYRDWSLHRIIFLCSQTSIKSLPPFAAEITTALYSCCSSLSSAITFLYKYAALKNPTDTQRPPIKYLFIETLHRAQGAYPACYCLIWQKSMESYCHFTQSGPKSEKCLNMDAFGFITLHCLICLHYSNTPAKGNVLLVLLRKWVVMY